jgi:hypothetical protein
MGNISVRAEQERLNQQANEQDSLPPVTLDICRALGMKAEEIDNEIKSWQGAKMRKILCFLIRRREHAAIQELAEIEPAKLSEKQNEIKALRIVLPIVNKPTRTKE